MTKKQPREHSRPRNRRPLKEVVHFVCEGEEEKLMVHAASPNRVHSARVVSTPGLRTRPANDAGARDLFGLIPSRTHIFDTDTHAVLQESPGVFDDVRTDFSARQRFHKYRGC